MRLIWFVYIAFPYIGVYFNALGLFGITIMTGTSLATVKGLNTEAIFPALWIYIMQIVGSYIIYI